VDLKESFCVISLWIKLNQGQAYIYENDFNGILGMINQIILYIQSWQIKYCPSPGGVDNC
jgi:hypothetical protein